MAADDAPGRLMPTPAAEAAPWLPRTFIPRRVLWGRLALASRTPVTEVVAPAGTGKTLGVAGWLRHHDPGGDPVWVQGAAISTAARMTELLDSTARASGPELCVIDDAHCMPSAAVRVLDDRLAADPTSMRVILLSRWDLPLRRLVPELLGHLTVLRADVLRLTDDECDALVHAHTGSDSPRLLEAIREGAAGWCAAVTLAARASIAAPSIEAFLDRSRGSWVAAGPVATEAFSSLAPREQHLLLCSAHEPSLTAEEASFLTGDPGAGELLAGLGRDGLLVHRVGTEAAAGPEAACYQVHPLMRELARRRLVAGGPDTERAQASVTRAAQRDLAQGHPGAALRRLVGVRAHEAAVGILADHGLALVSQGHADLVRATGRVAGERAEAVPSSWAPLAWAHWASGDTAAARHWAGRVCDSPDLPRHQVAAARLRSRRPFARGLEAAVVGARACLDGCAAADGSAGVDPWYAVLLVELGVAEVWLGDLDDAVRHLREAVDALVASGCTGMAAEASSHLAIALLTAGREHTAAEVAERVTGETGEWLTEETRARAEVVRETVRILTVPQDAHEPVPRQTSQSITATVASMDPATVFWARMLDFRRIHLADDLTEARRRLDADLVGVPLPPHLRVVKLANELAVALLAGDRARLDRLDEELTSLGALGTAEWGRGLVAEQQGDLRAALGLYLSAARREQPEQPPMRMLALVSAAQLADATDDPATALALMDEAVTLAQLRRVIAPFAGWSVHGTRVGELVARLLPAAATAWTIELERVTRELPSVLLLHRTRIATETELRSVEPPVVAPTLSRREHDVLMELARGSTYADIAANLYVSENTVKTHVSSLYAKLAVGRRSEALAVARKLHLV